MQLRKKLLVLMLKVDPRTIELEDGFTKNMSNTPAFASGDLEIRIENENDFEKAKHLIERAYKAN